MAAVLDQKSLLLFFFSDPSGIKDKKKLNPFRAPEPLSILLIPSNFVPKNGIPVVKGLSSIRFRLRASVFPSAKRRLGVNLAPSVKSTLYYGLAGLLRPNPMRVGPRR